MAFMIYKFLGMPNKINKKLKDYHELLKNNLKIKKESFSY